MALGSRRILKTEFGVGSQHDFALLKQCVCRGYKRLLGSGSCWMADLGYLGLSKIQSNVWLPHKRRKGVALGDWEKEENREHSRKRIVIEHVFGRLKVFKIIAEKYRNRRKRFDMRFNLIAAIHNFELP